MPPSPEHPGPEHPGPEHRGPEHPGPEHPGDLISFGWEIAEATLASAESELRLVTHWFLTPEDTRVNADDHFGSDERTLRFLGVALPTLIHQLGARRAVVALPWGLESGTPTMTVVGLSAGGGASLETRVLCRVSVEKGSPPFWRLETGRVAPPTLLAGVASALVC